MKEILIVGFTDLKDDPRVFRQIDYLRQFYRVTAVGWTGPQLEDVEYVPIHAVPRSRVDRIKRAIGYKMRRYEALYWDLYDFEPVLDWFKNRNKKGKFDLIIANDVDTLPLVFRIAEGAKILLDTHEYAPRHFADQLMWRIFFQGFNEYLCEEYLRKCDKVITVSSGIAGEYKKNYGVEPDVITNAAEAVDLKPTPVDENKIRIVSHGMANPNRRWEYIISIMEHVDSRFHLDLMLLPVFPKYLEKLKSIAAKRKNVSVVPHVPWKQLVPSTNDYDLSLMIFRPKTVNYKYGLFNKFFESLQARLAIVTGPSPEPHAEYTRQYNCGVVVDNFDPRQIGERLNQLTAEEIMAYKENSHIAAGELTAKNNMEKLGRLVKSLL